ncbi:MAG: hydrogenase maturation nickel metallochaperone HypA [Chloroflexi bacterium]|nr:hydrogenase maturation nickel metallochaperone HypA [Chloroflexota bacterium]
MHELAMVEAAIGQLSGLLMARGIDRALSVRFQRGSTFSEAALRQAFAMTTVGTPLEGADLLVDVQAVSADCRCGDARIVTEHDLAGHIYVCPACGTMREIEEAEDLRIVEVTVPG